MTRPIVLGITGASGAIYAARLLQVLLASGREVHLTISDSGCSVIRQELGIEIDLQRFDAEALLGVTIADGKNTSNDLELISDASLAATDGRLIYHYFKDYFTPIASGSFLTEAMVICPCSGSTLSGVVHAASQNLIQRAAEVHLKEHRKLIVVPRETPLSVFQLENMLRAAQAGAIVLPAMPGWYHGVQCLVDLVDFVVARILDQLGVEHQRMNRWSDGE